MPFSGEEVPHKTKVNCACSHGKIRGGIEFDDVFGK